MWLSSMNYRNLIPDRVYLSILFRRRLGYGLRLGKPRTFNEKIQWLKLFDRKHEYVQLVDKYLVKDWVSDKIGSSHVIPTYGAWRSAEDIDLSALPERFVLKTNHDCGGVIICKNKNDFDFDNAKEFLDKHLNRNYYWECREWPYKEVTPLIFAEEYIEASDGSKEIVDYKFMCFEGKVKCIFTCTGREHDDLRVDFFDTNWNHLPFARHYPNADISPTPPQSLNEMIRMAETLAVNIPFVRVDFYEVDGKALFGEMTFYPGAGFEEFEPLEWDYILGSWIELPGKTK